MIWARTGERVWAEGRGRPTGDDRTLRQRLNIPRDVDDRPATGEAMPAKADDRAPTDESPAADESRATLASPSRGSIGAVVDRLLAEDAARCVLLTDTIGADRAQHGAEAIVTELERRGVDAVHLHVGPADHGEQQLDGAIIEVDEFVEELSHHHDRHTLATGAVEPATIAEAIQHLEEGVERVVVTGTGVGADSRQRRLARQVDAVIVSDDPGAFGDDDPSDLFDHEASVIALLVDVPVPDDNRRTMAKAIGGVLVGLVLAAIVASVGWLVYELSTDDGAGVAEQPVDPEVSTVIPATSAAEPVTPTSAPLPPTTEAPPPDLGIPPELVAPPTVTVDGSVVVIGATRAQAMANRVRAAAAILADGQPVDDRLLIDDGALLWAEARIEVPLRGLRADGQLSSTGQRLAAAVVRLVPGPNAGVELRGGEGRGPQLLAALVRAELDAAGLDTVEVTTTGPGIPPDVVRVTVRTGGA